MQGVSVSLVEDDMFLWNATVKLVEESIWKGTSYAMSTCLTSQNMGIDYNSNTATCTNQSFQLPLT